MKKYALLIVLTICCTIVSMAQNGILKGKLVDKSSGEPLVGAAVMIKGSTLGTITNYDGDYELTDIEPGTYTFTASFIGYSNLDKEIEIQADQIVTMNFELYQDLIGLDEVMVTGVVNQKSALESSVAMTTIKPKFMDEFGAVTTAEMFKAIPGIRSESSGGEGNANIAVRGVPIRSVRKNFRGRRKCKRKIIEKIKLGHLHIVLLPLP